LYLIHFIDFNPEIKKTLCRFLQWVAVTLNVILLIVGVVVTIFGVILWKTDFKTYDDKVKQTMGSNACLPYTQLAAAPRPACLLLWVWLPRGRLQKCTTLRKVVDLTSFNRSWCQPFFSF
jgi:hypothetical protein